MTRHFQPVILRYDSLPSTNTEAARQAMLGAPEGLCVVAREQTLGRGRRERQWISPRDAGIYFSIVLRPRLEMRAWPLLTFAAALGVTDALGEVSALDADIKWPNDVIIGDRKLSGILAEAIETPRGSACILGIGINLTDRAFPPDFREIATSIEALTGSATPAETLLESLVRAIDQRYARLQQSGGGPETIRALSARSSYAEGKRVLVQLDGESFEGVTRGLECDGALRVEICAGEIRRVRAGDITSLRADEPGMS